MKNVKMLLRNILYASIACILIVSCAKEDVSVENGQGSVSLDMSVETKFQTKAVDVADYANLDNYTIQILKEGREVLSYNYASVPESIDLSNGNYVLKAFYGEDKPASTTTMYVEGQTVFNVNSDQQPIAVSCKPVCGRIKVEFDEAMASYFSDYSVTLGTEALGETFFSWRKEATDPVYLKVKESESVSATINLVKTNGTTSSVPKTYTLSPLQSLTIKVKPVAQTGNIGISIEIDDETNDIPVDIEIPADWK